MSLSNENNQHVTVISLGSPSTDAEIPGGYASNKMEISSVVIINEAAVAASDTNFASIELKDSDDNIIAELDTRAAHEGALAAYIAKALNLSSTLKTVPKGTSLKVNYNETDAGTNIALTNAVLVITWYQS